MLRTIFQKELRDQRYGLLWWCGALVAYVIVMCAVYPSVRANERALSQLLNAMPPAFKDFVLGQAGDFFSPSGYLGARLFALLSPLILLIYAVGAGTRAVAGEEDAGTLSLLLAYPLSRRRLLIEKYLAVLTGVAIVTLAHLVGLLIGTAAVGMDVSVARLLQASLSIGVLGALGASLAFAAGSAGARRGTATAAAAGLLLVTYLLETIALLVKSLGWLHRLSFFHYYGGAQVMQSGLSSAHVAVLLAIIVVCLAVAFRSFERRDIRL